MLGYRYFRKFVLTKDILSQQTREISSTLKEGSLAIKGQKGKKALLVMREFFSGPENEDKGRDLYLNLVRGIPVRTVAEMESSFRRGAMIWAGFAAILLILYLSFLVRDLLARDMIGISMNLLGILPILGCAIMAASLKLRAEIIAKKRVMGLKEAMGWE